jgi:hypothetical protein
MKICLNCRNWLVKRRGCSAKKSFDVTVENPMRSVDEYRRSAASMLDLAQRADSVADKNRLLV